MRVPLRSLLVAAVVTALLVVGGVLVLGGEDEAPAPPREQPFTTTPLEGYDTSTTAVAREPFCDRVDERQVAAALGDEDVPDAVPWTNGDQLDTGGGRSDLVHEYGCAWTGADGADARAWVFAPPVEASRAEQLAARAAKAPGCESAPGPAYGSPTLALTCTDDTGAVRASYRGLFGDAWVVCELTVPAAAAAEAADRAGRWCVGVLEALAPA
jgi:hypothetical protein